ncbi:hypothetical protein [Marinactinospora rubrisoli]|uniref:Uncharacterized protein n=1 Tax=Marinactinospora rubrisoli TaxID=2715399 RepID=A0ABW2KJJ9_9ACTN
MGHRHPTKLDIEMRHPRARWLLRAELAYCRECTREGEREALADLASGGMFDALWQEWVRQTVRRCRDKRHPPTYPALAAELITPEERRHLNAGTRECLTVCVVRGRHGNRVESEHVLEALADLSQEERARVLDDVLDGLAEGVAVG